jgi:predicted Fe-S protein YdhL (DUF1289 family)
VISSPCINICRLDAAGRVCVGCGRTIDEIGSWPSLDEAERRAIMQRLEDSRRPPDNGRS